MYNILLPFTWSFLCQSWSGFTRETNFNLKEKKCSQQGLKEQKQNLRISILFRNKSFWQCHRCATCISLADECALHLFFTDTLRCECDCVLGDEKPQKVNVLPRHENGAFVILYGCKLFTHVKQFDEVFFMILFFLNVFFFHRVKRQAEIKQ